MICLLQLLIKTGADGRQTVFLFADSQIKDEAFMEDISMILNTGDVPNLYASDEKAEIIERMQTIARNEVRVIVTINSSQLNDGTLMKELQINYSNQIKYSIIGYMWKIQFTELITADRRKYDLHEEVPKLQVYFAVL